jgi:hypothetical protein
MPENTEPTLTKRSVIEAAGAALAVGVGSTGLASAECTAPDHCCDEWDEPDCDEIPWFCLNECVVTAEEAEAYNRCPFDAVSHQTYIQKGRAGFVMERCTSSGECHQAVKVDFCGDVWWIRSNDLASTADSDCVC